MKQIKPDTIKRWKQPGYQVPKIDYTMNSKYYRVVNKGITLGASVDPIIALGYMVGHKKAELWEVEL